VLYKFTFYLLTYVVTLTFDFLTLKVVTESRVTWASSVPILVFLDLSVLDLGLMYTTDIRQTDVRQHHRLMPRLLEALADKTGKLKLKIRTLGTSCDRK